MRTKEEVAYFESVARTHAGQVRALNEDRFLQRADVGVWAVADGMGGHQAGDLASALVVAALSRIQGLQSERSALDAVLDSMQEVNRDLLQRAESMPGRALIGSTVVVLLARGDRYACVWAGDSRAYLLRDRRLKQITHDHSVVQQMVDDGQLTAADAKSHPRAHLVTRAVGVTDQFELEGCHSTIRPGDTFLLCSDGLSNTVNDGEIERHLGAESLETAADSLLALSLLRGARDNVTLVLVRPALTHDAVSK